MKTYRIHVDYKVIIPKTQVFNIQAESLEAALNKVENGYNLPGTPEAPWCQDPTKIYTVEGNFVRGSFYIDYRGLTKQYGESVGWNTVTA